MLLSFMSLKRARTANATSKNAVFGYIRRNESDLSFAVPTMVKYLCLNYYLLTDKWTLHGSGLELDESGETVIQRKMGSDTVYGETYVGSFDEGISVFRWTFEMINVRAYIAIGLDPTRLHANGNYVSRVRSVRRSTELQSGDVYSCVFNGSFVYTNRGPSRFSTLQGKSLSLKQGDQVSMILNVVDRTLRFDVNGIDHGIKLERIRLGEDRYFMATCFSDWTRFQPGRDLMKLIDFGVEYKASPTETV